MIREAFCTHGFSTDTFGHDTHHTALALSLILRSDNVRRNLTLRRSVEDGAENAGPVPALHDGRALRKVGNRRSHEAIQTRSHSWEGCRGDVIGGVIDLHIHEGFLNLG